MDADGAAACWNSESTGGEEESEGGEGRGPRSCRQRSAYHLTDAAELIHIDNQEQLQVRVGGVVAGGQARLCRQSVPRGVVKCCC